MTAKRRRNLPASRGQPAATHMLGPPTLALLLYLAQSPAPQVSIGGRTPSPLRTPQALLLPLPLASPTLPMPLLQHTHHHRGLQQSGQGVILAVSSREGDGRTIEIYVSTEFSSLSVAVIGRYERVAVTAVGANGALAPLFEDPNRQYFGIGAITSPPPSYSAGLVALVFFLFRGHAIRGDED